NTTPLFAVGYQKPQQTHYVQPVKTIPLFAVRYLHPHQTLDAQEVKPPQLVLIWLPEVSSGYRCVAS
ncbi:hypothetical protein, partial [Klebsiella pneumoniae]|uniref:hypothetical protein n=1 Tax=Klebsiella pneumoniae TaxID=573 RepID=UPI0022B71C62